MEQWRFHGIDFSFAKLSGFNLTGGLQLYPEFAALVFGLVTYTAGFIAEIVRAGVQAVSQGQTEAAAAIGLSRGQMMRLLQRRADARPIRHWKQLAANFCE